MAASLSSPRSYSVFTLLVGNGVLWTSNYSPGSLTEDAATPAKVDGNAAFAWTARRGEVMMGRHGEMTERYCFVLPSRRVDSCLSLSSWWLRDFCVC